MATPQEETEKLVDGVVDEHRQNIKEKHENLIENVAAQVSNYREMNVVFSEVRRRVEDNE